MTNPYQNAREKLAELIANAQKGMIIPVRLPGQLEEIAAMMDLAAEDQVNSDRSGSVSVDVDTVHKENAEFITVAVHELRTPMTSIRGYSDMLATPAMGELSAMQMQFVDTIRTNARRMEGLLQDVSDISKIRGNALNLTQKMDMFKNIAMTIEKETTPLADELNKTLTFNIPQGLPLLNTDGEYFAKAINKLVENGLRYSGDDGTVTVSAFSDDNYLVVTVADNGIGLSADELKMLGTLYWRADHDVVRNFKGSGLGIPIAYGIIDLLGGAVRVESTPDEGTTFTVRLRGMT